MNNNKFKKFFKSPIVMIIAGSMLIFLGMYSWIKKYSSGKVISTEIIKTPNIILIVKVIAIIIGVTWIIQGVQKLLIGEARVEEREFKHYKKMHELGRIKYVLRDILYFIILQLGIMIIDSIKIKEFLFQSFSILEVILITMFSVFGGFLLGIVSWEQSESRYRKYISKQNNLKLEP